MALEAIVVGRDRSVRDWVGVEELQDPEAMHQEQNGTDVVRFQPAEINLDQETLRKVLRDLRAKAPDIYQHGHRVAVYATVLGQTLGLSQERLSFLGAAAWLHDIGKLHVPSEILHKRGKLTSDEYETMKKHVRIGARLLRSLGAEAYAQVALHHHEWYSGWGYPFGIMSSELSVATQITSVADAYDAMTEVRCYRGPMPHDCALEEVTRFSGIQFSPVVVQAFLSTSSYIDQLRNQLGQGSPTVSDLSFVRLVAAG